jgi:hypothetical protein
MGDLELLVLAAMETLARTKTKMEKIHLSYRTGDLQQ